jgi:hypothetical protein
VIKVASDNLEKAYKHIKINELNQRKKQDKVGGHSKSNGGRAGKRINFSPIRYENTNLGPSNID